MATITFLGQPADVIGPDAAMLLPGQTMERRVESAEEHWIGPCLQLGPAGVVVGAGYVIGARPTPRRASGLWAAVRKRFAPFKDEKTVPSSPSMNLPYRSRGTSTLPPTLFNYLTRPAEHSTIDGSGMLRGTDNRRRVLSGIGDVFEMKMFNDVLGDYVERHVVEFEPDRPIAWQPVRRQPTNQTLNLGSATGLTFAGAGS